MEQIISAEISQEVLVEEKETPAKAEAVANAKENNDSDGGDEEP